MNNQLSLGAKDALFTALKNTQENGHLQLFSLQNKDKVWEWMSLITQKEKQNIYSWIARKKFASLNRFLCGKKFPLIPTHEQLEILHKAGYKSFRHAKEAGVII